MLIFLIVTAREGFLQYKLPIRLALALNAPSFRTLVQADQSLQSCSPLANPTLQNRVSTSPLWAEVIEGHENDLSTRGTTTTLTRVFFCSDEALRVVGYVALDEVFLEEFGAAFRHVLNLAHFFGGEWGYYELSVVGFVEIAAGDADPEAPEVLADGFNDRC